MCTVAWRCLEGGLEETSFLSSSPTLAALFSSRSSRFSPLSSPAPMQLQSHERTSVPRVELVNMPPHFCSRQSQDSTSLTLCTVELWTVGPEAGRTAFAATTHHSGLIQLNQGLNLRCWKPPHRELPPPFTDPRCTSNPHKKPARSSSETTFLYI